MNRLSIYKRLATPVAGSVVWNTPLFQGDIVSIHIKPTTATTTYGFNILGVNGLILFDTGNRLTGEYSISGGIDSCGEIMTCGITDSSVNEEFTIEIRIRLYENVR